jgi:hypothetical protein
VQYQIPQEKSDLKEKNQTNMNTKILMSASSVVMGVVGVALNFAPSEILETLGQEPNPLFAIVIQLLGALYFGFAILNWMAKSILIGGIYARPVSIGNFCHFAIGGLALFKAFASSASSPVYLILLAGVYGLFALLFGYVFLTNPFKSAS